MLATLYARALEQSKFKSAKGRVSTMRAMVGSLRDMFSDLL